MKRSPSFRFWWLTFAALGGLVLAAIALAVTSLSAAPAQAEVQPLVVSMTKPVNLIGVQALPGAIRGTLYDAGGSPVQGGWIDIH